MRVLYLTMNPNLGASARTLQDWLLQAEGQGLRPFVALRHEGALRAWLQQNSIPNRLNPMPWPDRRRPWRAFFHAWRLARWARQQGVQVIHCYEHDLYPFAAILRVLLRLPLVCHCHFMIDRGFAAWAFGGPKRPEALLWTSEQQRQDCRASLDGLLDAARQQVIPLGLSLDRFGLLAPQRESYRRGWGIGADDVVVGAASALRGRKRITDFLDLIERLQARDSRVFGLFAGGAVSGEEPYAEALKPRLKALEARGRFRWLGHLEPVEPFMHAIDVFVSTSEYETFGMSVCEAMACRRPVVGYRGGSVHEVVGDGGRIAPDRDFEALSVHAEELVRRADLRIELGARGLSRVAACFNPAASLLRLIHLYEGLGAQRG